MTAVDVDLTDLDRFTDGFPYDVFARLREEAPSTSRSGAARTSAWVPRSPGWRCG